MPHTLHFAFGTETYNIEIGWSILLNQPIFNYIVSEFDSKHELK